MASPSFLPPLISFLPISAGKLAFLLFKVNCTTHALELIPSYLFSTSQVILPYMLSPCLHSHSQVEEPCFNLPLPTIHHPPPLTTIFLERTVTFSHHLLYPHSQLQLFLNHLSHLLPLFPLNILSQGLEMTSPTIKYHEFFPLSSCLSPL